MYLPNNQASGLYKRKYAINFDLSISALEQYYSSTNPKDAYRVIKNYMEAHGFSHRQYSGYVSDKPMSLIELQGFTEQLYTHFPWLSHCVEKMDATIVPRVYDLKAMMENSMNQERTIMEEIEI